jgi:hypothetical protein
MNMNDEKYRANAAYAFGYAMEAASKQGVPDTIIAEVAVNIALGLIGAANGGPEGIPDALERIAEKMRANPAAPLSSLN